MDIGTGIAIAGVWIFAGLTAHSTSISAMGFWVGTTIAGVATVLFLVV